MKEDIFDVLIYLFENYLDDEIEMFPDTDVIATELLDAGFEQPEVSKAFDWLESLTEENDIDPILVPTFRIFTPQEASILDLECQDFLLYLENSGILTPTQREIIIDRALVLKDENITLDKLKWIVLMVLLSQSGDPVAFSRMEDIIYNLTPISLH